MNRACSLCGDPVRMSDSTIWKEVSGFVGGPKKDSMRLRKDTGRFAHDSCVAAAQDGQEPTQSSLLDDPKPAVVFPGNDFEDVGEMFLG